MRRRAHLSFAAVLFCLLFQSLMLGQDENHPAPQASSSSSSSDAKSSPPDDENTLPSLSLRVTTHMVVVDVIATDNHGKFVDDLGRDQFTVVEDGVPQKIAFFSKSAASDRHPAQPAQSSVSRPANTFTNRPEEADSRGLVIILLDSLNSATVDQAYARQQALRFLRNGIAADRKVAVFALTGELLMLQNFTDDPRILQKAIESFIPAKNHIASKGEPIIISPEEAAIIPPAMLRSLERYNQDAVVASSDERAELTNAALRALARFMLGRPGRKSLIWVSAGFPESLALYTSGGASHASEVREAAALLAQAQVAVYPVDVRGLVADPFVGENGELVPTVEPSDSPAFGETEISHSQVQLETSHGLMENLARQTGGHAFYNANDLSLAMAKAVSESSSYYTLGYYPQNKNWNGKFRNVKVRVQHSGVTLRARQGYFAVDTERAGSQNSDSSRDVFAAGSGLFPATGVLFSAKVVAAAQGVYRVDLLVDPATLSFVPDEKGLQAITLDLTALIAHGANPDRMRRIRQTVTSRLRSDEYQKVREHGFPIHLSLRSPEKATSLNLTVRDAKWGLLGSLTIPLSAEATAN